MTGLAFMVAQIITSRQPKTEIPKPTPHKKHAVYTRKQVMQRIAYAKEHGEPTYFGNPCGRCGDGKRYTKNSHCVYCTHTRRQDNHGRRIGYAE